MAIDTRINDPEAASPSYPRLARGAGGPGAAAQTTIILQFDEERGVCLYAAPGDSNWAVGDFSESLAGTRYWVPLPAGSSITITAV